MNKTNTFRVILCWISGQSYALDMAWVRSIHRSESLRINQKRKQPSLNEHESDRALNLDPAGWIPGPQGELAVFNLGDRFGDVVRNSQSGKYTHSRENQQRIVVVGPPKASMNGEHNGESQVWGLIVDQVSQVMQISSDHVRPLPELVVNPTVRLFKGVINLEESLILYLAPESLNPNLEARQEFLQELNREIEKEEISEIPPLSTSTTRHDTGTNGHKESQIVIFPLNGSQQTEHDFSIGLSISQVPEIVDPLPTITVPMAPNFVSGLVNWRGRPIPLIDLAQRLNFNLGEGTVSNGQSRMIVVRDKGVDSNLSSGVGRQSPEDVAGKNSQGVLGAFLIHPSIRVERLPIDHRPSSRRLSLNRAMTKGVFELKEETLILPDVSSIFSRI